jgi:hypothetical protein
VTLVHIGEQHRFRDKGGEIPRIIPPDHRRQLSSGLSPNAFRGRA